MTRAFEPGDPVLELAALGQGVPVTVLDKDDQPWLRKAEQQRIDEVCALLPRSFVPGARESARLTQWLGPLP